MPFKMVILKVVFKFEGVFVLLSMTWVGWEESRCGCLVLGIAAFFNDEKNHLIFYPSLFQLLSSCVFMTWKVCISRPLNASLLSLSSYETCNSQSITTRAEALAACRLFVSLTSLSLVSLPVLPTFCVVTYDKSCLFPISQGGKSLPCLLIWVMFKRIRSEFNNAKGGKAECVFLTPELCLRCT